MNAIYGVYAEPASAQRAVEGLRAAGLPETSLLVLSAEPWGEYEFGAYRRHSRMPWLAACGGFLGGVVGFALVAGTQQSWPLRTGGMPIVTLWSAGIITYEMTMLGAILATVLTLFVSSRLWPARQPRLTDPALADGFIVVGASEPPDHLRAEIERRLREAGSEGIKTVPGSAC
ncbi:MAG: DUF3341 domain-containing protein [Firmicutes bacterium]|nr:DUF3341 domain-containing protein [Bacillota bacterium]